MVFGKFREQALLKKFKKELSLLPASNASNSKTITSIAILTDNVMFENIDIVEEVKKSFASVRIVQIYSFRRFKKSEKKSYKHFTEKDIDWKGVVIDASLESFLAHPFDLLIGYFNVNNLHLEYCALKSKATFKVGFSGVNDKIYDLVISENPNNIDSYMTVAKKYLKLLHKL